MRIVVTGATGFLGGWALRLLRSRGYDAIGVSRKSNDSARGIISIEKFSNLPEGDVLLHFAESNNRFAVNEQGESYLREVISSTNEILNCSYDHFVYASSIAVYDDKQKKPHSVADKIIPPDFYGRVKLEVESAFLMKKATVLRVGNAYGEGMSPLNVISTIMDQIELGHSVKLLSLDPVRDYVWAGDIAEAFLAAVSARKSGIYNVASGRGYSVREVAQAILKVAGKNLLLEGREPRPDSCIVLDNHETIRDLGWKPVTSLEEGMFKTWNARGRYL